MNLNFMTKWPEIMGTLSGEKTLFPEKIISCFNWKTTKDSGVKNYLNENLKQFSDIQIK